MSCPVPGRRNRRSPNAGRSDKVPLAGAGSPSASAYPAEWAWILARPGARAPLGRLRCSLKRVSYREIPPQLLRLTGQAKRRARLSGDSRLTADGRPSADDGSADPDAAAALAAFASGAGSEHAALTALASTRLLVPVLAAPAQDSGGLVSGDGPADHAAAGRRAASHGTAGTGAEKTSEMSIPALVGQD